MILYHRTTDVAAREILRSGFRDATGTYLTEELHTGVWLSDGPLDCNEGAGSGADTDVLFSIELPVDVSEFEWVQGYPPGYREFLVPASLINEKGTIQVVTEEEGDR
jgi:hypothetical protein